MARLLIGAHWMACIWGMLGREISNNGEEGNRHSWIDELSANKLSGMEVSAGENDNWAVYIAGLHFAIMTITSIGYGDIYPMHRWEYIAGFICQAVGGVLWAVIIATICAIFTTADPVSLRFNQTIDELNQMMDAANFPPDLCQQLRLFFINAQGKRESEVQRELLEAMSPRLRGDIASRMLGPQVRSVWYFTDASDGFVAAIAVKVNTEVFNKAEDIRASGKLCIMNKGIVVRAGMIKCQGSTWGEDFVLSPSLRREEKAIVLAFAEILTLSHDDFYQIFASVSADDYRFCRKIIAKMTVVRGIIRHAQRLLNEDPSLSGRLLFRLQANRTERDATNKRSSKLYHRKNSILMRNLEKKRAADAIADEQKERRTAIRESRTEPDEDELSGSLQTGVSVSLIRHVVRAELRRSEDQSDKLLQRILQEVGQIRRELNAVASPEPEDTASRETAPPSFNPDLDENPVCLCAYSNVGAAAAR
jgi:hypothetical protein